MGIVLENRAYFDANIFGYFFLHRDKTHKYSPFLKKFLNITSPFSLEEFSFNFLARTWGGYKSTDINERIERFGKLRTYLAYFKIEQVEFDDLCNLYLELLNSGLKDNLIKIGNGSGLDSYDCLHLSYALLSGVEIFLTSDSGFGELGKSSKVKNIIVRGYKLRKIEIYDRTFKVSNPVYFP